MFIYTISDGHGGTDMVIVMVFVNLVDSLAPLVLNDVASTPEDTPIDINVLANDNAGPFGPLTINDITQAANGNVTANLNVVGDGIVHYIPDPQFNGHDVFFYVACNTIGNCVVGKVTVTVESVNDVPVARDDLIVADEDADPIDIDVMANDSDEDMGDNGPPNPAQFIYVNAITSPPTQGDAVIIGTGADSYIRYTPRPDVALGYHGDQFTYQICDSFDYGFDGLPSDLPGDCDEAIVVINLYEINDPPVAINDIITTPEDTPSAPKDLLANDSDPEGDAIYLVAVTQPAHGAVAINGGGFVVYIPNPNFYGNDHFTYTVCDVRGGCAVGQVDVNVGFLNDTPVANDDVASTQEEAPPITIDVLANDYDVDNIPPSNIGLTIRNLNQTSLDNPAGGDIEGGIAWIQNNKIMFMPNLRGIWTFTYEACDPTYPGLGGPNGPPCDTATVTVFVSRQNNPPIGLNDVAVTNEDTLVSIPVLANDYDPDNLTTPPPAVPDVLHIGSISPTAAGGTVVLGALPGNIDYTPPLNFTGIDIFTYTVCDQLGACSGQVTVQVTVRPVADVPFALNDFYITNEDTAKILDVLSNDSDGDGQALRLCAVTVPTSGWASATIVGSGAGAQTINYQPGHGFHGHDQFTYTAADGPCGLPTTNTTTAVVDIAVVPVNQAPDAISDTASTTVGEPIDIDVLANDVDFDLIDFNGPAEEDLTIRGVSTDGVTFLETFTASGFGKVTINGDGDSIHFDPDFGFEGQIEFWYKVCDVHDACDTAKVTVSAGHAAAGPNSISGIVYFDLDLSGSYTGEPEVVGARIQIWNAHDVLNPADDEFLQEDTQTGCCGYSFDHLPGNTTYILKVVPSSIPPGFIYSDDPEGANDGIAIVAVNTESFNIFNQDFGLVLGGDMPETR
jgi:hypothetical protein